MSVVFRAATGGVSNPGITSIATAFPTGTTTGDLVLITVECANAGVTYATPAGWTKLGEHQNFANTGLAGAIFARVLPSGAAAPTIAFGDDVNAGGSATWSAVTFSPGAGGTLSVDNATDGGRFLGGGTSVPVNAKIANAAEVASVVVIGLRSNTTNTTAISSSPPTNWTGPTGADRSTSFATTTAGSEQLGTNVVYRLQVSGTVAPGNVTINRDASSSIWHFMVAETVRTATAAFAGAGTLAATVTGGTPPIATLTDTFSTQDNAKWTGWGAGQVEIVGGRVQITPTTAYYTLVSAGVYSLAGSAIAVEVPQVANQGNGSVDTILALDDLSAGTELSVIVEGGVLYMRSKVGGANNDTTVAYDAVAHRWWRISESSGTVTWATSPDAAVWTTRRTAAPGITLTNFTAWLQAGYWGTEPNPGVAVFDNLNVVPGPALTAAADFTGSGTLTAAASGGTTHSPVATLVDTFSAQDNAKWTGWAAGQAEIVGGRLQIASTTAYYTLTSAASYDLTGSSLTVEVAQTCGVGTTTDTALILDPLTTGAGSSGRELTIVVEGTTLTMRYDAGAGKSDANIAYDATAMRWWRISESGGTVTWATSPDGQTWTAQRTAALAMSLTDFYVHLQAGYWGAETSPRPALFDNVNVASGSTAFAATAALTGAGTLAASATGGTPVAAGGGLRPRGGSTKTLRANVALRPGSAAVGPSTATAAFTGSGSLTAAATPRPGTTAAFTGLGVLAATASGSAGGVGLSLQPRMGTQAGLRTADVLRGGIAGSVVVAVSASFTGAGTLTATPSAATRSTTAALAGTGTLSAGVAGGASLARAVVYRVASGTWQAVTVQRL